VQEEEAKVQTQSEADSALLQHHTELIAGSEVLKASLAAKDKRIKALEKMVDRAEAAERASSSLLKDKQARHETLRGGYYCLEKELDELHSCCHSKGLELQ
jgi:ubiquinone biosynthesis protein Coq4